MLQSIAHPSSRLIRLLLITFGILPVACWAAGGPLGIDHRLSYDNSGIRARHDQILLEDGVIHTELGGAYGWVATIA